MLFARSISVGYAFAVNHEIGVLFSLILLASLSLSFDLNYSTKLNS